ALSSPRYLELLGRIELAAEAPHWNGLRRSARKLAGREFKKFERATKTLAPEPSNVELHRVRVRGKRARYAGELAEESVGKRARRFVARAKRVQDILGEHQDAVVADERLRELALSKGDAKVGLVAGRPVEERRELEEGAALEETLALLRELGDEAVFCTHGEVLENLFGEAGQKGSTRVVELRDGEPVVLEYLPPPA